MKGFLFKIDKYDLDFLGLLVSVLLFFNFHHYFFLPPQGVHFIRQTDSLSFVNNYYENGFRFFNPSIYNLMSTNGNAACEFPIIYYFTAFLYLVFGEKEFLLKTIHLIIFLIGLFHVYKLSFLLLKNHLYAYLIPLFILSSTSLAYYSFNYLPDSAALGFAFSGWYFIYQFKDSKDNKYLLYSTLFFVLSSLLKVTYLVHPIAAYGMILMVYFFSPLKSELEKKMLKKMTLFFGGALLLVLCWNSFVLFYNSKNNSTYFTTNILPMWNLSPAERMIYWKDILGEWYKKYLAETSFHFLIVIGLFMLFNIKKVSILLRWNLSFLVSGSLIYFILFFLQFRFHDYYFLLFFPLIVFLLIAFFESFQKTILNTKGIVVFNLAVIVIIVAGLNYARMKTAERYKNGNDSVSQIGFLLRRNILNINHLQIPKKSRVIIGPDLSVSGGLNYFHRNGWVLNKYTDISVEKINELKSFGADYFFLIQSNSFAEKEIEKVGTLIFKNKDILVYKL